MRYGETGFIEATDGTPLFFGAEGPDDCIDAPTLVFCDGLGCDGFAWRRLFPNLSQDYPSLHIHYRDHGRSGSSRDRTHLSIHALAADLHTMLRARDVKRAVLIGHSMGTQVALESYRADPSRIAGLVLVCGSYGRVTETFHGTNLLQQILPTVLSMTKARPMVARALWGRVPTRLAFQLARLTGEVDERLLEEDFVRYWEHAALVDPDVFLGLLQAAGEHTAEGYLGEVDIPTFVIAAENDTFTPMTLAKQMAQSIPEAAFEMIESATHAAPVEQPDYIAERIRLFIRERVR